MQSILTRSVFDAGRRLAGFVRYTPFVQQHIPDAVRDALVSRKGKGCAIFCYGVCVCVCMSTSINGRVRPTERTHSHKIVLTIKWSSRLDVRTISTQHPKTFECVEINSHTTAPTNLHSHKHPVKKTHTRHALQCFPNWSQFIRSFGSSILRPTPANRRTQPRPAGNPHPPNHSHFHRWRCHRLAFWITPSACDPITIRPLSTL